MTDSQHTPRESASAAGKQEPSRAGTTGDAGPTKPTSAKHEADRTSPPGGTAAPTPAGGTVPTSQGDKAARDGSADAVTQLVVTLSGVTGEILNVEKLGPNGKRTQLSADEYEALANNSGADEYEAALEEAYETGIEDALNEADEGIETEEAIPLGDLVLGRVVLRQMLERKLEQQAVIRVIEERLLEKRAHRPPRQG